MSSGYNNGNKDLDLWIVFKVKKYYICFLGQLTSGIIMYIIPAIHMNYQNCNIEKPSHNTIKRII